ncbi:tryptase-like [Varroa jacobsoni]|uniref:Peptidase S1 domain-containing protein n=1 Tax=Varroa destructor TaxID=109461 RepID=A0A7M7K1N1_VARDE|nr:tryptase-like [Varroa destructor]XP_022659019.1 tryptase-like [Varroa destructor]XP_022659020.1 tryptase-like [Varroa destructor]XP_022707615.1 tryptase-like [Varroa jacobsoni]XP_022707616.1 tryptase-like [Varroa jacobsoni]
MKTFSDYSCVLLGSIVLSVAVGQSFTFRETQSTERPVVGQYFYGSGFGQQQYFGQNVPSIATPIEQRRDNPNDPYNQGGMLPNLGPIQNGGVQKDPPAPDDVPPGQCICVPFYQCTQGHINDDGSGILDARTKSPPQNEIPLDGLLGGDENCPGIDQLCCKEPRGAHETSDITFSCGIRNDNGLNSRILQKHAKGEAEFGEWPWQAAVLKNINGQVHFECGGTLISSRHVLTVAHCVYKSQASGIPLVVRLGEWDTKSEVEFYRHADYLVKNIIIHPNFRNASLWNDIAVLEVDGPIQFQPHIQPICLPNPGESYEGHDCIVTGWGKNSYRSGSYSNIMKEVKVPVIENVNCQQKLRRTRLGPYFKLFEGFICAGSQEGEDSCKGDGGGPLSCYRHDGRYALAGLVSWGIDCGSRDVPGVYVRVTRYLDWIAEVTGKPISSFNP